MSSELEFRRPIVGETATSTRSLRDSLADLQAERPESDHRSLTYLPATTQKLIYAAEKLSRDFTETPAPLRTPRLAALIDDVVSNLVPLMAAEERVLYPHLALPLVDALEEDHREVRRLVERLNMLLENLERSIGPAPQIGLVLTALLQLTRALGGLLSRQGAALDHLDEILSFDEPARPAREIGVADDVDRAAGNTAHRIHGPASSTRPDRRLCDEPRRTRPSIASRRCADGSGGAL